MSTLLNGVNEVLKDTDALDSDVGLLASLTDSARQVLIDTAVRALNEVVDELYDFAEMPKPNVLSSNTITLATNDQSYALQSDLIRLRNDFNFIDRTNNHTIYVIEDGFRDIIVGDPEQDDTGQPTWGAINPEDGEFYLDRKPTANENGAVYTYYYEKDTELTLAADIFPFNEKTFRAVTEAAAELYRKKRHLEFSEADYNRHMARATRALRQLPQRRTYGRMTAAPNQTDPLSDQSST